MMLDIPPQPYEEDFLGQRGWSNPNLVIGVGEGFWYNNASNFDLTWIVNKPYLMNE